MPKTRMTLTPYASAKAFRNVAAEQAGKSRGPIFNWSIEHGIGLRVGGGQWIVSKVALAMYLDRIMRRYGGISGDRTSERLVTRSGDHSRTIRPYGTELPGRGRTVHPHP